MKVVRHCLETRELGESQGDVHDETRADQLHLSCPCWARTHALSHDFVIYFRLSYLCASLIARQPVCMMLSIRDPESLETSSLPNPTLCPSNVNCLAETLLNASSVTSPKSLSFYRFWQKKKLFSFGGTAQAAELKSLRPFQFMCFDNLTTDVLKTCQ